MSYEVQEIKTIRKKLGLTQNNLAKQANVSQSLITKIEAGTLDPTYSKVTQIFEVLNSLSKTKEKKAKDIMNKKLIYIEPETNIKDIIKEMRKHSISQMPVVKNHNCVGLISETIAAPIKGCVRICSRSESSSLPSFDKILSSIPILPISCKRPAR